MNYANKFRNVRFEGITFNNKYFYKNKNIFHHISLVVGEKKAKATAMKKTCEHGHGGRKLRNSMGNKKTEFPNALPFENIKRSIM